MRVVMPTDVDRVVQELAKATTEAQAAHQYPDGVSTFVRYDRTTGEWQVGSDDRQPLRYRRGVWFLVLDWDGEEIKLGNTTCALTHATYWWD